MSKQTSEPSEKLFTGRFILLALANFVMFGSFQMANSGMPVYIEQMGGSELAVGFTITFMTAAALLARPFSGLVLDTLGRKRPVIAGTAVILLTVVLYWAFPLVGVILALRIVHGLGWGLSSTGISTMTADVLPKKRFAEGMGWFGLGTSVSMAIGPALAIHLVSNVSANAMLLVMGIAVAVSLAMCFFLKESLPEEAKNRNRKPSLSDSYDKRSFFPSLCILLVNSGFSVITTFVAVIGLSKGVDNISLYFVFYAVVNLVTRPVVGKFIDRNGFFAPAIVGILGMIGTLLFISQANTLTMFCIAGAVAGLAQGINMSVYQTMAVLAVPPERRGVATSTYFIGVDGGFCLGSAIGGAIAGALGYSSMFMIMIVGPVAALVLLLANYKRWNEKVRLHRSESTKTNPQSLQRK